MPTRLPTYPLTSPQIDIYQDQFLRGTSPTYNIGGYLELSGDLKVGVFEQALRHLTKRHDAFRIVLTEDEQGVPRQSIAEDVATDLAHVDFSAAASPGQDARAWIQQRMNTPFALTGQPLFRWALLRVGEGHYFWFVCVHHLIADGWALDRIFLSFADAYRTVETAGPLSPATPSYLNFVAADLAYLQSDRFEKDRAYWLSEYETVPEPLLRPRQGRGGDAASGERSWKLSGTVHDKIDEIAAAAASSKFQVMLALFCAFFLRMHDRDELTIGLSVLNRRSAEERQTVGLFANVIPVTLGIEQEETFLDFVGRIGPVLRRRYRHQRFPIGTLNKELKLFRHHRSQLYELSISYEHGGRELLFGDASAVTVRCSTDFESTPLRLCVRDNLDTNDAAMYLIYEKSYFDEQDIEALETRFTSFMDTVLTRPVQALSSFSVVSAEEANILRNWNDTLVPSRGGHCLHELFEAQVERDGSAIAVVQEGTSLSYAELNAQANRIAHAILSFGLRPDDRVAICVERSIAMIAGLIGILKAGAAYVPIDAAYASARTRLMLEDARPALLLTDAAGRSVLGAFAAACPALSIDAEAPAWTISASHNPRVPDLRPHHLAYVIYTSGSTGRPKGVMVEHRNVCHQVLALQHAYDLGPQERLLQFASSSFDMAVEEIFPALSTGAVLVLRTEACLQSPAEFAAFCSEHRLTSLNLPSGFWAQIALAGSEADLPPSVRRVVSGGDTMSKAALTAWFDRPGRRPQLFNAYGPTEATVNATLLRVEAADQASSIGRPLPNTQVHLLDRSRQPVPIGMVGEVYIGGAGVARGYLHAPELTAERFVPDPFSQDGHGRMYRTGDLARHRADGTLEFLGRIDHQVKIRGYRVEVGETESRLTRLADVREAVVLAWGERPDQRLVAYVVARPDVSDERAFLDGCRDVLASELPDYMIPAAFIRLPALPLTASGKLDRNALPDPALEGFPGRAYAPPRGILEHRLARLWQDLLGTGTVGRHDSFFDLGGHSLSAMRLLSRVRQEFSRPISLQSLFDHPTLAGLAAALEGPEAESDSGGTLPPIGPAPREPLMPLSYAQQRLWFLAQLDDGSAAYHIPLVLHLKGDVDRAALRQALDHLVMRHESLRTNFVSVEGRPFARILPATTPCAFDEHDLAGEPDAETLAARHARAAANAPFDLQCGPLIRAELLRVGSGRFTLLLTLHHIAGDGWSMDVLAREFGATYGAFSQGRAPALPALPIQYSDYAGWQQSVFTSQRLRRQRAYWQGQLKDAPELLHLPTDRPRPARQSSAGAAIRFQVDPTLTRALTTLCRQQGVTSFMIFAAAWSLVLARLSGQDDVVIGTLSANRAQRETEALIGFFVNTLALRLDLSGDPSTVELLRELRRTTLAMQENQDLPFEQVVEAVGPSRRLEHTPLFQVLLGWQSNDRAVWSLRGLEVDAADIAFDAIRYDLELHLTELGDTVSGLLGYATALFDEATIVRYRDYLLTTLRGMVAEPDLPCRQLPLVGADETALQRRWNETDTPSANGIGVHRLFEAQAARTPDAIALLHEDRRSSYAELDARAERWARTLRALGAQPGRRVGICVDRGFEMVTGILAILKAGAAYVPLDPSYPRSRLLRVIEEADVLLVLTDAVGRDALGAPPDPGPALLDVDEADGPASLDHGSLETAFQDAGTDDVAYVIYTSGSTGTPKGVAMPHRALVNLLGWQEAETARSGLLSPCTLQFAALGFDVAFQEIFTTLCGGASLVFVSSETRLRFTTLVEVLRRHQVQRLFLPYVALQALAEALDGDPQAMLLPDLRELIIAGEQLRLTPQIRRLFRKLPRCALHNHYGPTETHVVITQSLTAHEVAGAPSHVPIGRPIANARAYVLDPHGEPVAIGAVGELFIGGAGMASGYLHRPELTAERFLADPFDARPGARLYRTGDLARFLPDGRLVYVGRTDRQIKVRGFRVEVGEIEAHLAEHDLVRECGVVARDDGHGGEQLVAYVVRAAASDDLAAVLHGYLGHLLPAYMVPAAFVAVDALPLTANGKLDRDALPAPDEQSFARSAYEAPQGETETTLARLWQDLLGVPRVGRRDRFFDLGGHSLLSVRLLSRIAQAFGARLPLVTLFARPVLADLAAAIEAQKGRANEESEHAVTPAPRTDRMPLSHAQQRLWFLAQLDDASSATYHVHLAYRLRGALDADTLRAALGRLVARHESLRTAFGTELGQPYAFLLPAETGVAVRQHDLRGTNEAEASLGRLLAEDRNHPFDLSAGPLIRAVLVRLAHDRQALQITLHHIVADGWSLGILGRELGMFYAEALHRHDAPVRPLPIQYADYVAWQRASPARGHLPEQSDYWRRQLSDAPMLLELPTDRPRPARQSFEGAFSPLILDRGLTQALRGLARRHDVTLVTVLLAAWAAVLSRLANQDEVVIGIPTAGRSRPELEELVGFFVNTLALRISLAEPLDMRGLLGQVQRVSLEAQAHQDLPFEQVVDLAGAPRRLDCTPLFQVILAWQDQDEGGIDFPGVEIEGRLHDFDWVKFDLELVLGEVDGVIHGGLNYATALFERETIDRHVGYLRRLLGAMTRDKAGIVQRMPLLPESEALLLLKTWNRTLTSFPDQVCIHQLLESWAEATPQATALAFGGRQLSYRELNARANQLAHHLIELGVRPGHRIASIMGKGMETVIGPLAVMKAGAVHIPIDPAYTSTRLGLILDDASPEWVLCDGAGCDALASVEITWPRMLDITRNQAWSRNPVCTPLVAGLNSGSLAYMIYTSGSTGIPKGVLVEHRGVVSLAYCLRRTFGISKTSRVSQFASVSFDASIMELVMAFAAGAALYLPSRDEREGPAAFVDFVDRHQISHVTLPPAFLQSYTGTPNWTHRPALILAGEASAPGLVQSWRNHARLFNAYGPTEISICATVWTCPDGSGEISAVPIGRPVDNARLYVLDRRGQVVPRGSVGELHIGGIGVARGYWKRPELTEERFLPDPFSGQPGARMYRSGDMVRYLPDGDLLFVGRDDHQVKLRGFRVELGEVEAQLLTHPDVRAAAVLVREDRPGDRRMVAYVVVEDGIDDLPAVLRSHLATCLPDYMIPIAFVVCDRLPLTPHGKLDRKAMPVPREAAFVRGDYDAPRGASEQALATLWRELLSVERVGRRDNFFDLGGHSLLAVRLAASMHDMFGRKMVPRDVFLHPMLEEMAALIDGGAGSSTSIAVDLGAEVTLDATISAAMQARYCAEPQQILLTGASGFLGAFLLRSLLRKTTATVHCLIRCTDVADGWRRLNATMRLFGLPDCDRGRVVICPGDLALPRFGLSQRDFDEMAIRIDVIHHNGARVDALHSYSSLKAANVGGTQEILRLAASFTPKHVHYVSTMSTIPPLDAAGSGIATAADLAEFWPALPSGYAQSKWVAERILRLGRERGIPATVYRLTHVGACTETGASNPNDTWSLFIDACLTLGRVPAIDAPINSLPVDVAAAAIVESSLDATAQGRELNLLNPESFRLNDLTRAIADVGGPGVEEIDPYAWRKLCIETLGNAKFSLIMPEDEPAPGSSGRPAGPSIVLPNALADASVGGIRAVSTTRETLRQYVAWRHRRLP